MRRTGQSRAESGFSLVEVLVAMIIIAVGLLGIAKMQALLLADSGISRVRALVALEAASLAASMHANEDYWASAPSGVSVTISPTSATPVSASGDANLANGVGAALANPSLCEFSSTASYCTPANMAGYDLVQWEQAMNSMLSGATTQISCQSANLQIFCTIDITWTENLANANREEQGSTALQTQSYQLVVEP